MSSFASTQPPPPVVDALEQRDPWRGLWQAVTSDMLLALLCAVTALAWAAGLLLPQAPAGGTADPLTYSQWQTQARALTGAAFDALSALALFSVNQALWFRLIVTVLAVVIVLRLLDRVAQLAHTRRAGDALRDEERVRVTDQAPSLDKIADRLRAQRYRVNVSPATAQPVTDATGYSSQAGSHWLTADRAPWAFGLSLVLHAGLLLATLGILANSTLGWDAARQPIDAESATPMPGGNLTMVLQAVNAEQGSATVAFPVDGGAVTLSLGQPVPLIWVRGLPAPCCLSLQLAEITPGFRVSAMDVAGKPLTVTASSYADPAREVLLTFRRDEPSRLIAIEQARVAVLVSEEQGGRVQVYDLPSGHVLTDTLIRPSIVISNATSNTTLQFNPTTGAVVAAKYQPGDLALWPGAVLAFIGVIGTALWPVQRLVVRHHGHWTEFYASGRGMRQVVRALIQQG